MADAIMHKLYVLETGTLTSMSANERFLKEFPFLRGIKAVPAKGCGTCGGGNRQRASVMDSAKAAIAGMGSERKRKLKEMLKAKQVRVVYTSASGGKIQLTF